MAWAFHHQHPRHQVLDWLAQNVGRANVVDPEDLVRYEELELVDPSSCRGFTQDEIDNLMDIDPEEEPADDRGGWLRTPPSEEALLKAKAQRQEELEQLQKRQRQLARLKAQLSGAVTEKCRRCEGYSKSLKDAEQRLSLAQDRASVDDQMIDTVHQGLKSRLQELGNLLTNRREEMLTSMSNLNNYWERETQASEALNRLIRETGTSGATHEGQNSPSTSCAGLEEPSQTDSLLAASDPTKQAWYNEVQRLRRAHLLGSSQAVAAAAQSAAAAARLQTLEKIKRAKLAGDHRPDRSLAALRSELEGLKATKAALLNGSVPEACSKSASTHGLGVLKRHYEQVNHGWEELCGKKLRLMEMAAEQKSRHAVVNDIAEVERRRLQDTAAGIERMVRLLEGSFKAAAARKQRYGQVAVEDARHIPADDAYLTRLSCALRYSRQAIRTHPDGPKERCRPPKRPRDSPPPAGGDHWALEPSPLSKIAILQERSTNPAPLGAADTHKGREADTLKGREVDTQIVQAVKTPATVQSGRECTPLSMSATPRGGGVVSIEHACRWLSQLFQEQGRRSGELTRLYSRELPEQMAALGGAARRAHRLVFLSLEAGEAMMVDPAVLEGSRSLQRLGHELMAHAGEFREEVRAYKKFLQQNKMARKDRQAPLIFFLQPEAMGQKLRFYQAKLRGAG
ncbi:unnamed protein product [Ostreobium quekettii]|uniref:HAUS augmin-like complex subunit 3 N-terminal domain-containing protein n=1 Tax=Ostreobium quekettii TaxID=121088 RepID=A0A8S1J6J7_9CHLO|nr:unnamed protein product [Ostreobium quekettii]